MLKKNTIFVLPEMKIADVALNNPLLLLTFEHFGLGFEFNDKSVLQVCKENKIGLDLFLSILNLFNGHVSHLKKYYSIEDIETLIEFLKKNHNYYKTEKYPNVKGYLTKMLEVNDHPKVLLVEKFFNLYYQEVMEHFEYENSIVFPYILELFKKLNFQEYSEEILSLYTVSEYKEHHDNIEEKLADLKNLLIKYLPIKNDQILRRELLIGLFDLEFSLGVHRLIEDNILVPIVEQMEKKLKVIK